MWVRILEQRDGAWSPASKWHCIRRLDGPRVVLRCSIRARSVNAVIAGTLGSVLEHAYARPSADACETCLNLPEFAPTLATPRDQ
jgi:hypothetical protein